MTRLIGGLAALSLALLPAGLSAQMPPVHVYGGEDREGQIQCRARYADAIAAAEAVLRSNGVAIASEADYDGKRAIGLFVNLNVGGITDAAGRFTGLCVASVDLSFRSIDMVADPVLGRRHAAAIVFCERGSLMTWPVSEMGTRLNRQVGEWVSDCVAHLQQSGSEPDDLA